MKRPVIRASKPQKGVRDHTVKAELFSNRVVEVSFSCGKCVLFRISFLKDRYLQRHCANERYDRYRYIKSLFYQNIADDFAPEGERLIAEAVKATNEVLETK